jgi:ABC-2 type transport system permease protein
MVRDLARILAIARRDLYIEGSYRLRYFNRLIEVAITGAVVYQLSKLIVDAPQLARYDGGYFEFALVGLAVMTVARLGISTFNSNIVREQTQGTLEVLMATPTRVAVLLAGSFVFPLALTAIDLVLYSVGIVAFGDGVRPIGLLYTAPLLALTLASFCAFGVMGAALVVLTKRGDPLTGPITALTSILSGAVFPVSTFPLVLRILARVFPAYYGIHGLREALLTDSGWRHIVPDIAVLAAFDIVLLPLSVALFTRSLAVARRTGTLSNF